MQASNFCQRHERNLSPPQFATRCCTFKLSNHFPDPLSPARSGRRFRIMLIMTLAFKAVKNVVRKAPPQLRLAALAGKPDEPDGVQRTCFSRLEA
ncbi:hypothetical protein GGE07_006310 [Sinorhizobium terangae]|nr:hypothetical protein [Sinorhizobium terangae]